MTVESIHKALFELLRAHVAGGMPPMVISGVRQACRAAGLSEKEISEAAGESE